jgi:MYXO-CTERM domain-containing protein
VGRPGEVTIPSGSTLTIQPGAVITAAAGDTQGSGNLSTRVELIIYGTLNIAGATGGGSGGVNGGTGCGCSSADSSLFGLALVMLARFGRRRVKA